MLNDFQCLVLQFITEEALSALNKFHNGEDVADQISVAAGYAFALHSDLVAAGIHLKFNDFMLDNRRVPPTDPEFFR